MTKKIVKINRAPVLTLWAVIIAERLGHDHAAALTLGKSLAGLNAQSKGQRLGIFEKPTEEKVEAKKARAAKLIGVPLLGREIPAMQTPQGLRAINQGQAIDPGSVERYLAQKFGADLADVQAALQKLASAYTPKQLAAQAYPLYEKFRPKVPEGERGWGAKGE